MVLNSLAGLGQSQGPGMMPQDPPNMPVGGPSPIAGRPIQPWGGQPPMRPQGGGGQPPSNMPVGGPMPVSGGPMPIQGGPVAQPVQGPMMPQGPQQPPPQMNYLAQLMQQRRQGMLSSL